MMQTSFEKSGHRAPPSGMQNRFEQFSRQAHTAQLCRGIVLSAPDKQDKEYIVKMLSAEKGRKDFCWLKGIKAAYFPAETGR
ncbi:MAG: hypothetical protein PHR66_11545 [Desulfuromonadaceae bacterium]|nr:hypothetical protein [Desulfuromonadaceae bacterium]